MKWLVLLILASLAHSTSAAMEDNPTLMNLMVNQLEHGDDDTSVIDLDAWVGKDLDKIWLKSELTRKNGSVEESELQLLYSRAIAPYWDLTLGVRHDFDPSPGTTWAAFGVQGLAPYFFDTEIALFVGEAGQTALRFEVEYDLLLSQKLILTPDLEINFYGKEDKPRGIGTGLSEIETQLRLRYEFKREFAPYIGITFSRKYGDTRKLSRLAGNDNSDSRVTLGLKIWL